MSTPLQFLDVFKNGANECLLEPTLEKLKWCHVFHATVLSHYKMREVLITHPICLARFTPQLSKELAHVGLDSQPMFLFSNPHSVMSHKTLTCLLFYHVLLKIGK